MPSPSQLKSLVSSVTPQVLFTIGESVNGFTPTGIPDGIGAFRLDDNTIRVLVNSEIASTAGNAYKLANGLPLLGARINYFDVNNAGVVVSSNVAYNKIVDRSGNEVTTAVQINGLPATDANQATAGLQRFCAGNFSPANPFGAGKGNVDPLYLVGEESNTANGGKGGYVMALDVKNNVLYAAPDLGRFSVEQALVVDTGDTSKVAYFIGDDSTPGPAWLYVGTKVAGSTDFLARNGLKGGQLYVWVANDTTAHDQPVEVAGTGTTVAGSWKPIAVKDATKAGTTGYDAAGYLDFTTLHTAATALGAMGFARVEDAAINPAKPSMVAFNATGQTSNATYTDLYGTIYTIDTTFTAGLPTTAILKNIYDGDDAGKQQAGVRSPDNMEWSPSGAIILNEDRAISNDAAFGTQEGSVWSLDPATGVATRIALIDRTAIPTGMTDSLAKGIIPAGSTTASESAAGQWETSGTTDVSALYGNKPGTDYFIDVQAHGLLDGAISANKLVEGGQLLRLTSATTPTAARLIDPLTGLHLTTADSSEVAKLVGSLGWRNEGASFVIGDAGIASAGNYKQVFRLFNPASGDHLLTTNTDEISAANRSGYVTEGVAGRIQTASILGATTPVNRLFNGKEHLYTSSASETAALVAGGWRNEGVLGYVA